MSPAVTIAVVPRERFSYSLPSLQSLYAHTAAPFDLVYVDGGSPPSLRRRLAAEAAARGFRLLRTEHYLSPNEARNLALAATETEYIFFVDNDVLVEPSCVERLVACADATGADAVTPLYYVRRGGVERIHSAGGLAHFVERDGHRFFVERHGLVDESRESAANRLRREPTEMTEFHAVLARRDLFDRIGMLDPALLSAMEHLDFSLALHAIGGALYFEPEARLTYVPGEQFRLSDLPYYWLRWSEEWNVASVEHFRRKWSLEVDDPFLTIQHVWLRRHRRLPLAALAAPIGRAFGERTQLKVEGTLDRMLARIVTRGARAGRARAVRAAVALDRQDEAASDGPRYQQARTGA